MQLVSLSKVYCSLKLCSSQVHVVVLELCCMMFFAIACSDDWLEGPSCHLRVLEDLEDRMQDWSCKQHWSCKVEQQVILAIVQWPRWLAVQPFHNLHYYSLICCSMLLTVGIVPSWMLWTLWNHSTLVCLPQSTCL